MQIEQYALFVNGLQCERIVRIPVRQRDHLRFKLVHQLLIVAIEQISQVGMEYRHLDLVGGVKAADELLQTYLRRYARIVTSRLHSYLPATSQRAVRGDA